LIPSGSSVSFFIIMPGDEMSYFELFSSYESASPSDPLHNKRGMVVNRGIFIRMHRNLLRVEAMEGLPDDLHRAQRVQQLKEANDRSSNSPPLLYSRRCPVCSTPQPRVRVCYTICGHITCLACNGEMLLRRERNCPVCGEWSGYVSLYEEEEENEKMEKGKATAAVEKNDEILSDKTEGEKIDEECEGKEEKKGE
ncbi:hypothetical protein PFISCL1PPCAC_9047, partial [Pristionchus fissidentatus]